MKFFKISMITLILIGLISCIGDSDRISKLEIRNDTRSVLFLSIDGKYFSIKPGETIVKDQLVGRGLRMHSHPDGRPGEVVTVDVDRQNLDCPYSATGEVCLFIDDALLKT